MNAAATAWAFAQRPLALAGLAVLAPVMAGVAVAVKLDSPGPVVHRSTRISSGHPFTILKFRTMRAGPDGALRVTAAGDARVTRVGRGLRRTKLDELPQLWNMVRGEMRFVGPRPEDPRYVDWNDPLHREVFGATPGITGPTALEYREEEAMLAAAARDVAAEAGRAVTTADDVERAYRERILPRKLEIDAAYLRTRSVRGDLAIIGRTIGQAFGRTRPH